jgi:HK97 gp10 family phage protein
MTDASVSKFRRTGNKTGSIVGIMDDMEARLTPTVAATLRECAEAVQAEIVKAAPVDDGGLKAAFASPDALVQDKKTGFWAVGLFTTALGRAAYYWKFVEYGTKGYARGEYRASGKDKNGQQKRQRMKRAVPPRPAHPFVRPAVAAARARFKEIAIGVIGRDFIAR